MAGLCRVCARTLSGGRFCPHCGSEQSPAGEEAFVDPLLGRILLGRYEITQLISVGGMGLVYKAVHRPLGRTVAVKLVHPQLLGDEQIVSRFLSEAQIASRLNHPNIVSIHDFGRAPTAEGGELILVMELLTGPSLSELLRSDGVLSIERIADILCQTLGALGEAHYHGVVHRDVKPANIILEPVRGAGDRVKLIDFGIARLGPNPRITLAGQVLGTPSYMAPEQMSGGPVGPSADLYSVGVLLFRMLTGQLPFTGSPDAILAQQRMGFVPDPRTVAPEHDIPEAVAEVCTRALAPRPDDRYPSAEALAQALLEAATRQEWSRRHSSLFRPPGGSTPPPWSPPDDATLAWSQRAAAGDDEVPDARDERPPPAPRNERAPTLRDAALDPHGGEAGTPTDHDLGLVGRMLDLAWAEEMLAQHAGVAGFVMWGRPGVGRTRLLREVCLAARRRGSVVVLASVDPPPWNEVSFHGLRALLAQMDRAPELAGLLDETQDHAGPLEVEGMRVLFESDSTAPWASGATSRRMMTATVACVLRTAVSLVAPRPLVIAIDDADRLDGPSLRAVSELLSSAPIEGVSLVATSERSPGPRLSPGVPARELAGLSLADARRILLRDRTPDVLDPAADSFEPLYVDQLARWAGERGLDPPPPAGLVPLLEARLDRLGPHPRRALQALAVTGGGDMRSLASIAEDPESFHDGLLALANAGIVEVQGLHVRVTHALFARLAEAMAPRGAVAALHARAAEVTERSRGPLELLAHHAVRGEPDLGTFLLVEECARRRSILGDDLGVIALLSEGLRGARLVLAHGHGDGAFACLVFGQKLGRALVEAGKLDEAAGVLTEVLDLAEPHDLARALVLEQLGAIASQRGRQVEADALRGEALEVAHRLGEPTVVERLTALLPWPGSGAHKPREALRPPGSVREAPRPLASARERPLTEAPRATDSARGPRRGS
jgi:serine/threonine-protein kinase